MIDRSAENDNDRRVFLKGMGVAGLGVVGAGAMGSMSSAQATPAQDATDAAVLNFALNLEYLEAEFYQYAAFGTGLGNGLTGGKGKKGNVKGGRQVTFATPAIRAYAIEIAQDELAHVKFLRKALGSAKVARPAINIQESFTAAAQAAGLITAGQTFDPYANENNFLLAAFIFEDVGVSAYKGGAPLITNKTFLEAAAGILAVEAYHAGIVRTVAYSKGLQAPIKAISDARDSLDGPRSLDNGIGTDTVANLVPTNKNALAYTRSTGQVLNVVYLNPDRAKKGGFFPRGLNGAINESSPFARRKNQDG